MLRPVASALLFEFRCALRSIRRRRLRSALIITVLGLSLATNVVMFSVLDGLFVVAPPLISRPDRIVRIEQTIPRVGGGRLTRSRLAYPDYSDLPDRADGRAAFAGSFTAAMSVGQGSDAGVVSVAFVTSSYFSVLGVSPLIGRSFTAAEGEPPQGAPVVVLSYDFWLRHYQGSAAALGRRLDIGGVSYSVVGVLPATFAGPDREPIEAWLPLAVGGYRFHGSAWDFNGNAYWIESFARLPDGLDAAAFGARLNRAVSGADVPRSAQFTISPLNRARGADRPLEAQVALWLAGVAVIVLLIACANVGNLFLLRALERRTEFAVRTALGGASWRIAANVAAEAFTLCMAGGGVALIVGAWGNTALTTFAPGVMPDSIRTFSPKLLAATLAFSVMVALITSAIPILKLKRGNLQSVLRVAASTTDRTGKASRFGLLVAQVALTTILIYGSGLFLESFTAVSRIDLGFDANRVLVADLDPLGESQPATLEQEYAKVQQYLKTDSRIAGTAIGQTAPFLSGVAIRVIVPGHDSLPTDQMGLIYANAVTPDFFPVIGLRLTRGRPFLTNDPLGDHVAVVSQSFASGTWAAVDPIGKCIQLYNRDSACYQVVGVIADPKRDKLGEEPVSQFLVPLQSGSALTSKRLMFASTRGSSDAGVLALTQAFRKVLPNSPFPRVVSLANLTSRQRRPWALGAVLFSLFGGLALIIACLGLYNVVADDVRARDREFAIRITLGASAWHIARAVLTRTGGAAAMGLCLGLALATWMGLLVQPMLFRTDGVSPTLDVVISFLAIGVAAIASFGPIRRAIGSVPAAVLRDS